MSEYRFFRVDDGIVSLIDHEFVLENPYELLVREKTTKDIFLRFKYWSWNIKNLTILDYLSFGIIGDGGNVHDENHEVVYLVPFTNFGVYDYKFIFKDVNKTHEIFMITDMECDDIDRPIIFNNFEAFDKSSYIGDVTAIVKHCGLKFSFKEPKYSNEESDTASYWLFFDGSMSELNRVKMYSSDAYKNGSVDFNTLLLSTDINPYTIGFSYNKSDFTSTKICNKRYGYFTSLQSEFSIILFDNRMQYLKIIYRTICEMVDDCSYLTRNMRNDLELILLRWYSERFNEFNPILTEELIRVHHAITKFVAASEDVSKHISSVGNDINRSLYR